MLDIQARVINGDKLYMAKQYAQQAGYLHSIRFKQLAVKDFSTTKENGVMLSNPPYGKRLSDQAMVRQLTKEMGQALSPSQSECKTISLRVMGL